MQDVNELIEMFPEEKGGEVLRSAEIRPKRENFGAGIYKLVIYFDGNTYSSGKPFLQGNKSQ